MISELSRALIGNSLGINTNNFFWEIIDMIIMSLAIGFIFKDFFQKRINLTDYDPLTANKKKIFSPELKIAILSVAPAILLHEMGHKFAALVMGIHATFYAAYGWLLIGILLKLMGTGIIFFIPGYVAHAVNITPSQSMIIAFMGPFMNLVLWFVSMILIKNAEKLKIKNQFLQALYFSKSINLFLFFFNMIPVPPFDGYHVFKGLFNLIF